MALFVPLNVDYQLDPKIIDAGPLAECLFVRALAQSKRTMVDGIIQTNQLPMLTLGLPGASRKHADALVRAGLWTVVKEGWFITAWFKWNASADEINEKTENKKQASIIGNHERWHVDKGKRALNCPLCYPSRIPTGSQSGSQLGQRSESIEVKVETEVEVEPQEEEETTTRSSSSVVALFGLPSMDDDEGDSTLQRRWDIARAYHDLKLKAMKPGWNPDDELAWRKSNINYVLEHPDIDWIARLDPRWEAHQLALHIKNKTTDSLRNLAITA